MKSQVPAIRLLSLLVLAALLAGGAAFVLPPVIQRSRDTALLNAICRRDVASVHGLLDQGANPNKPQTIRTYHETGGVWWRRALRSALPSHFASEKETTILPLDAALPSYNAENADLVKERDARRRVILGLLLAHGANPNVQGPSQNPPLFRAVLHGDKKAAQTLLDCGANPNTKGTWPHKDFVVEDDLREQFVGNFLAAVFDEEGSPLMKAAERGDDAVVSALLARHADHNVADKYGRTALHYAVDSRYRSRNRAFIVRALLAAGANPAAQCDKWLVGGASTATPAAFARASRKRYADSGMIDKSDKKERRDFAEALRLLDAAEADQAAFRDRIAFLRQAGATP